MPKEVETIDLTPQQQLAKDAGTAGETRVGISNDSPTTLTLASETFPGQVPAGEKPEVTKNKGVYVVKHTAIHVEPYMRESGDEFTPADLELTDAQLDRLLALKAIEAKTVATPVTADNASAASTDALSAS